MNGPLSVCCLVCAAGAGLAGGAVQAQEVVSLRESVATALRENPALESARAARESALAEAERTRPRFQPDLQLSASQFVRGPILKFPKGFEQVTVLPRSRSRLMLSAEQTILVLGVGRAPQRRSSALVEAAEADYEREELDLALAVEEAYFAALQAQAFERVALDSVDLAEEQLRVTRLLVDQGLRAPVDIERAEVSVAEARAGLIRARNGIELSKKAVNLRMGRPLSTPLQLAPVEALPPEPPPTEEALADALRRRPDAQALRARIDVAESGARLAKAQRMPRAVAQADYALQNRSAFVPTSEWQAGVTVSAPVFETQRIRADVRQAQAGADQARSGLRALEQGIQLEMEQARVNYLDARADFQTAEENIESATEVRRTTMLVFEAGRATFAELESTRLGLTRALAQRAQAVYDMWLADARWRRAAGLLPRTTDVGSDSAESDAGEPAGEGK